MRHKKVQVVVINKEDQKLFLFQVSKERDSFWQNVTGSVDDGEKVDDAAKRELLEETSIIATQIIKLPFTSEFCDRWQRNVEEHSYLALTDQHKASLSEEHQSYKLVPLQEVEQETFHYESNFNAFLAAKEWLSR